MNSTMSQPLSQTELDRLEAFLNAEDFPGMALDETHGFLTAVVSGPEIISPQDWLPLVFGGKQAVRKREPPQDIASLLLRLNSEISLALFGNHDYTPWIREHPAAEGEPLPIPEGWCMGYLEGVNLYPLSWRRRFFHNQEAQQLLIPVMAFGFIDHDNPEESPRPQTEQEQRELAGILPDAIRGLFGWWREQAPARAKQMPTVNKTRKIGRNETCPCGSGRKYKKCCGSPASASSE